MNSALSALYTQLAVPDTSFEASQIVADENEIEIYLDGVDVQSLVPKSIKTELQTQYGLFSNKSDKNACASSHRVRETILTEQDETTTAYEHTFKLHLDDGKKPEHTVVIDREGFDLFRRAADSGMIKTRLSIPAMLAEYPNVIFQCDVFKNTSWLKVDLELPPGVTLTDDILMPAIDAVFVGYTDIIVVRPSDKAAKSPAATRAHSVMQKGGVLTGPFTD